MTFNKLLLNFRCGKSKGAIFLTDAIIALFIVVITMMVSIFFLAKAEVSSASKIQANRIATDIFAVLDYSNTLSEFDAEDIRNGIDGMLPNGYSMEFKIECEKRVYDSRNETNDNYAFAGERIFMGNGDENCIARYWVWPE